MLVGEAPGESEDSQGVPFIGKAGNILEEVLTEIGWTSGIYLTNIGKCRPPNNRVPTLEEQSCCSKWLLQEVKTVKPIGIICLGRTSAEFFLKDMNLSVEGTLRSRQFLWKGAPVLCTWHPMAIGYPGRESKREELKEDLLIGKDWLNRERLPL